MVSFTILFTNDHHGQLEPMEDGWGGVARRAAAIAAVRQEVGPARVVLVDGGDLFTGGPLSASTKGEADAAAYQAMGYDAIAIGNHDLDYGIARLRELRKLYRTPWISANLVQHGGVNVMRPYVFRNAGVRIGLVGFSTPETPQLTKRENTRGMVFNSPIQVAHGLRTILKKDADIFVAVSHLGLDGDQALAKSATFLHVIVGGHSHTLLEEPVVTLRKDGSPDGPIIVQAGEKGRYLGRLDLTVEGDKKSGYRVKSFRYRLIPLSKEVAQDPVMLKLLDGFRSGAGVDLGEKVCEVAADSRRVGDGDWTFACFCADEMRKASGAEVALINTGSFRTDLKAGPLTKGDLLTLLPFEDQIVTVQMTGALLRQVLERSLTKKGAGGFLQLSGVAVSGQPGNLSIQVGEEPLSAKREYKVAINDFLAGGGDGYEEFPPLKTKVKTGIKLRETLVRSLRDLKTVPESVETVRWSVR